MRSTSTMTLLVMLMTVATSRGQSLPDLPRLLASRLALQGASSCARDSRTFLEGLGNFSLDAVSMYDASVKAPEGVLWGSTFQLGHYDECVGVASAQYCVAHVHYRPLGNFSADSAWPKLLTSWDDSKIPRDRLEWALCLPASCSPSQLGDASRAAAAPLAHAWGGGVEVSFDEAHCTHKDDPATVMGAGSLVYLCFLAFLVFLVIMGSVIDSRSCRDDGDDPEKASKRNGNVIQSRLLSPNHSAPRRGSGSSLHQDSPGLVHRVMVSFSAPKNLASLTRMKPSEPFLDVMHFHKAVFMMLIVGGHRLLVVMGHPLYNGSSLEQFPTSPEAMLVANGPALVDVFFTYGGFLLSYLLVADLQKHPGVFKILLSVINRYLRLTPMYAMVIAFYVFVLPYMGSGPYWKAIVVQEQQYCREQWWVNILYVNNYVGVSRMCMLQTWYLSADFQMCVMGLVLIYLVHRWPRVGWTLLVVVTLTSMVVPFLVVYKNGFYPILKPYWKTLQNLRWSYAMFVDVYIPSHTRATPYLLGIMAGFLMRDKSVANTTVPQSVGWGIYLASWMAGFGTMMISYVFFIPGRAFSSAESATYFVGQKVAFSVASLGILLSISFARLESLRRLLWCKLFVVLSRLTYSAFIIHMATQIYDMGGTKTPFTFDAYHMLWGATADYVVTYALSFLGFVLVEAPFRNLVKILIG